MSICPPVSALSVCVVSDVTDRDWEELIINKKHRAGRFVEFTEAALQCLYIYIISSVCTVLCREDGGGGVEFCCQKVPSFALKTKTFQ